MCFRNNEIREILPQLFPIFPQTIRISKIRKVMPTRRLAAVLFADIVGYTAMMQQNETEGMAQAQSFRHQVPQLVQVHQGEVIEIRGDGALCLFNSAAEATACAQQIQVELGADIPLRIGIHLGDVMQHSDHIMGDAVNIASRIESMGVAGAVLLSSSIRQQIKNKPEFELVSLGKFAFKNVAEPMTVYALGNAGLVVPKADQMKGKGDQLGLSSKRIVQLASLGFVAMALGAVIFWATGMSSAGNSQLLDQDIREAKVAVAVFENFTGDEDLDALGNLASEWITSSLRELGVKTVAPEMMRQYKQYVGILPDNPEGKTSLLDVTKAEYLVSGSYFTKGKDSIRLNARLLSARTGDEIQVFPTFYGKQSNKEELIEAVRQRLMGYWAMESNQYFPKGTPPSYKAYQQYIECVPGEYDCYIEVLERDSTFILAHISLMSLAAWGDYDSLFHASKAYVESRYTSCTQYEKNHFQQAVAFWEGDYKTSYKYYDANYQLDTMDLIMLHQSAYTASIYLNQPGIAEKRYKRLFSDYETFREYFWPNNFHHYSDALIRTGKSHEFIQFVQALPEGDWKKLGAGPYVWLQLYIAYLDTGEPEQAVAYIDTIEQWLAPEARMQMISKAAYIWSVFYQDQPNPFHVKIRKNLGEYMEADEAGSWDLWSIYNGNAAVGIQEYQHYLLQDWKEAERLFNRLKENPPNFMNPDGKMLESLVEGVPEVWIQGMLGCIYARLDKNDLARKQLELLDHIAKSFPHKHTPILRGIIPYHQACIHALLGNKAEAVTYLEKSRKAGKPIFQGSFLNDFDLASLIGYPPFEELIRPKG